MKKVLLTTTALMLSSSIAWAEVSVGGDGRMGVIGGGSDDTTTTAVDETDLAFTSRIRISFSASGETDAGLSFGGSIRADNAVGGAAGTAGSVFVEGTFGKISMGDVAGAPEAAAGDLSGVGLTGLGDINELVYLSNSNRPAARWDYTTGDLGLHVSMDNPGSGVDAYGVAVTYSAGDISFGLGYENADVPTGAVLLGVTTTDDIEADHIIGSVTAGFGDATVKVAYGTADLDLAGGGTIDFEQMGVSVDYVAGATTLTAFYVDYSLESGGAVVAETDAFGIGASYDLGGGASLKGGIVDIDGEDDPRYDLGISMSF